MKKAILLLIGLCITLMAEATSPTTISVASTAGGLSSAITTSGGTLSTVTNLTITGTIDARDFKTMRDDMKTLTEINLTNVTIAEYNGQGGPFPTNNYTYLSNVIPAESFNSKSSLTSISLPTSITTIEFDAFTYCTGLTSINIPISVTSIGVDAFDHCTALASVTIPTSITTIGDFVFADCYALTSVVIPSSVTTLGTGAFDYCSGLTSINIPSSVTAIGGSSFDGCTSLNAIYINNASPVDFIASSSVGVFYDVNKTTCILHVPVGSKVMYEVADQWKDFTIVEDLPASVNNKTATQLKVSTQNGQAILTGLPIGQTVTIYNLQGTAIYNQLANAESVAVSLPAHGVYVVRVCGESVKVLY